MATNARDRLLDAAEELFYAQGTRATGIEQILRTSGGKAHLNACKSRKRKRNLRGSVVADQVFNKTAERMLQGN